MRLRLKWWCPLRGKLSGAVVALVASLTLSAADLRLELTQGIYDGLHPETGYRASYGSDGAYLWASYDKPKLTKLGQGMGGLRTIGAGVGARRCVKNGQFCVFGEFGKYWVDINPGADQQHEVVTDLLRGPRLPNPDKPFGDPPVYEHTRYELRGELGARFGVEYRRKHVFFTLASRHVYYSEHFKGWIGEEPSAKDAPLTNRVHLENNTLNGGAVEVTIGWRF